MGLLPKKAPDESSFRGTSQTTTRFLNLRDLAARWKRVGLSSNYCADCNAYFRVLKYSATAFT
jgi:hypothetical protein